MKNKKGFYKRRNPKLKENQVNLLHIQFQTIDLSDNNIKVKDMESLVKTLSHI